MPRQPNYKGQRIERDRAKELKRAARNEAKAAKSNARKPSDDVDEDQDTQENPSLPQQKIGD